MGRPLALSFFPFPYVQDGHRHDGVLFPWPERCDNCDRQCERATDKQLRLCSYGVNYCRLRDDLLIAGIVVQDFPQITPARAKMLKRVRRGPTMAQVEATRKALDDIDASEADEIQRRKNAIIADYVSSTEYKREILEMLKPHLKEMSAGIHDYRQFVSRVIQNLNVILEKRYPGVSTEEKLGKASHEEVAIYWAARLMEEKLRTVLFLLEPERLDDRSQDVAFRFHGCAVKYVKIYQRSFEEKGLQVRVSGESFGEIVGNPAAIGVIPHTLLDNALKYGPRGTPVEIRFLETDSGLMFSVGSYGPRLAPGEEAKIFDLFYRGVEAKQIEPEGSGFGLHLAQLVANQYGTVIRVRQDSQAKRSGSCWTEFTVEFPKA